MKSTLQIDNIMGLMGRACFLALAAMPLVCFQGLLLGEFVWFGFLFIMLCYLLWRNYRLLHLGMLTSNGAASNIETTLAHQKYLFVVIFLFYAYLLALFDPSLLEPYRYWFSFYYTLMVLGILPILSVGSIILFCKRKNGIWCKFVYLQFLYRYKILSVLLVVICLVYLALSGYQNPSGVGTDILSKNVILILIAFCVINFMQIFFPNGKTICTPVWMALPVWMLGFMGVTCLVGALSIVSLWQQKIQAERLYDSKKYVESAKLYRVIEEKNWPELSLATPQRYHDLVDILTQNTTYAQHAVFFLKRMIDFYKNRLPDDQFLLSENFFLLGKTHVILAEYDLARLAFDQSAMWRNPVEVLTALDATYTKDEAQTIWGGRPYITLEDFENTEHALIQPWTSQNDPHVEAEHHLETQVVHSGKYAEYIRYVYEQPLTVHYDYWMLDTEIAIPPEPRLGFRFYAKSKTGAQVSFLIQVYHALTTGTYTADPIILTNEWQVVEIRDVNKIIRNNPSISDPETFKPRVTKIGFNTHRKSGDVYVDDFQLFLY